MSRVSLTKLINFLRRNPEHAEILRRALAYEEKRLTCKCGGKLERVGEERGDYQCTSCGGKEWYLGFEWHEISAPAVSLNKLVYEGFLRIPFKSRSSTHYTIVDHKIARQALELAEAEERAMEVLEQPSIEVPGNLFDFIVGYDEAKDVLQRSLKAQQPVHVLLVGPPSTAKSLFLMEMARLPNSRFALGGTTSKAGIVDFLIDLRPSYLIIDEIDKMDGKDVAALLTLMETGIVTRERDG